MQKVLQEGGRDFLCLTGKTERGGQRNTETASDLDKSSFTKWGDKRMIKESSGKNGKRGSGDSESKTN